MGLPCDECLKVGLHMVCIALVCISVDGCKQTSVTSSTKCMPTAFTISLTQKELVSSAASLVQPVQGADKVVRGQNVFH